MTQAEIDAALRVFRPTASHVERLQAGGEQAVGALNEIVQGIYQQAVTMAQYQMQLQMQQVNQALTPLQQFHREQALTTLKNEFFSENPDLKGFDPLLNSIHQEFVGTGTVFKTKKEAFDAVAKRAREVVKSLPGVGQANNGQPQPAPAPPHNMSTLIGGGQGGNSGTPSGGANERRFAWQDLG